MKVNVASTAPSISLTNEVTMKHTGTIRWFDSLTGTGFVRGADGVSYLLHFTAILGVDKNNYAWMTKHDQIKFSCIDGLDCEFELIEDTTFVQVSSLRLIDVNAAVAS